jgi:pyrroloquinoline-quinone synthase
MFTDQLRLVISNKNMLKHEFYTLWSEGKLNQDILAEYAKQYYAHVKEFPCYISAIHSQCKDLKDRQTLLENLIEEERGPENHPQLWRDFASELGVKEDEIENSKKNLDTEFLVDKFFTLCKKSYASGLGALYAYEHQIPDIAETKIKGLKEFYQIDSEKALKFFEVHRGADIWHSNEVAELIEKLSTQDQIEALKSASQASDALWGFLDGMLAVYKLQEKKAWLN